MTHNMNDEKNPRLDLNLLTILSSVIETGSATLAAERLGLSSSSISYALNKLREHFSDPIVIRTSSGVKPTLLAMNLYNNTQPLLDELNATLKAVDLTESANQPAHLRTIRIRTNSIFDFWLSHQMLNDEKYQNGYTFEFYSYPNDAEHCLEQLRTKQIDIDIGFHLGNDRSVVKKPLPAIKFVALFRKDHPRINNKSGVEQLAQEKKFGWMSSDGVNSAENPLLAWFTEKSIRRTYLSDTLINAVLHTSRSDAITIVPEFVAPLFCDLFSMQSLDCDLFDNDKYALYCHIHRNDRDDPVLNDIINIMTGI
ncbi:LysR family transcriptional regulator [Serratia fonticola]|uniref:LysR family transcriptional regulator n=1 Tax=Serratia fonticola TaxID=47917 RepID=UPI003AAF69EB